MAIETVGELIAELQKQPAGARPFVDIDIPDFWMENIKIERVEFNDVGNFVSIIGSE